MTMVARMQREKSYGGGQSRGKEVARTACPPSPFSLERLSVVSVHTWEGLGVWVSSTEVTPLSSLEEFGWWYLRTMLST